jgi:hypothetical protein
LFSPLTDIVLSFPPMITVFRYNTSSKLSF